MLCCYSDAAVLPDPPDLGKTGLIVPKNANGLLQSAAEANCFQLHFLQHNPSSNNSESRTHTKKDNKAHLSPQAGGDLKEIKFVSSFCRRCTLSYQIAPTEDNKKKR